MQLCGELLEVNSHGYIILLLLCVCVLCAQLSARDNSLVRMDSVAALTNLVTLNLQNNSLTEIAGEVPPRSVKVVKST